MCQATVTSSLDFISGNIMDSQVHDIASGIKQINLLLIIGI